MKNDYQTILALKRIERFAGKCLASVLLLGCAVLFVLAICEVAQ